MDVKKINFCKKTAQDFNILTRLYQYYAMYVLFLPIFATLFYNFKINRNKNIDKKKLYIVAPNHISYLDVFLINYVMGVPLAYIAKQELFRIENWKQRYVAKNIYRLGAFAVNREKVGMSTIKSAKEVFKANYNLCIFPQGGIRKNKVIEGINEGFIYFAKTNKVDIIPVGMNGLEEYNWKPFRKKDVIVNVGEPISWELSEEEILKQWCEQVAKLANYENKQ
ncbi:1-acyl-sn-glycerol-3-phosphate acyltransferase [bacterium]|nr:1-acyl-sn-glycerol-3-phosphate acyltransferase [bacterium]